MGAVLDGWDGAVCYPQLLQEVKHTIIRQCQQRGVKGLEGLRPAPPAAGDLEAMAALLYEADLEAFEAEIGPQPGDEEDPERPRHQINLRAVYETRCEHCAACRARGPFVTAVLGGGNATNNCYIRVLMCILDGRWPLPQEADPEPYERAGGNYPFFEVARAVCPVTLGPVLEALTRTVLRPVTAGHHPMCRGLAG